MPRGIPKKKGFAQAPAYKTSLAERREKAFSSIRAQDHLFAQVIPSSTRDEAATNTLRDNLPVRATASGKPAERSHQGLHEVCMEERGAYGQGAYGQGAHGETLYGQGIYEQGAYEHELPDSPPVYQTRSEAPQSRTEQVVSTVETEAFNGIPVQVERPDTRSAEPRDRGLVQFPQRRARRRPVGSKRAAVPSVSTTYQVTENVIGDDFYIPGSSAKRQRTDCGQAQQPFTVVRKTTKVTTTTTTVYETYHHPTTSHYDEAGWKGGEQALEQQGQMARGEHLFSREYGNSEFTFQTPNSQYGHPYGSQRRFQSDIRMPGGRVEEYNEDNFDSKYENSSDGRAEFQQPRYFSASPKPRVSEDPKPHTSAGIKKGCDEVYDEAKARAMEEKITNVFKRAGLPSFQDRSFTNSYDDEFHDEFEDKNPRNGRAESQKPRGISGSLKPQVSGSLKQQASTGRKRGLGETDDEAKARAMEEKITNIFKRAGLPSFQDHPSYDDDYY